MNKKIIVQGRPFTSTPSGFRTFSTNFFRHLAQRLSNFDFEILTMEEVNPYDFKLGPNVRFVTIPLLSAAPDYVATMLWENIQMYDYVRKQDLSTVAYYLSPYNSLPIHKLPVPQFVILHDIDLWIDRGVEWAPERRFGYEVKRRAMYNADHIFTVSEFSKSEIMKFLHLQDNQVTSIHEDIDPFYKSNPSVDMQSVHTTYDLTPGNYFLYIGSNEPRKNVASLVTAYEKYFQSSKKKVPLVIAGSVNERTQGLTTHENHSAVRYIKGPFSLEQLYSLYKGAYAFVYPSIYEGFGLQVLEAQNAGTPIILSDIAVFKEIAGDSGLYFDPKKPDDIAAILQRFEESPSLRDELIQKGSQNTQNFNWDKTVETFLSTISTFMK